MNIIDVVKPDILGLVETKLAKNASFIDLVDWEVIKRNGSKGKSGVMCAFRKGTFQSIRNVTHTDDDRILSCRVVYKYETVRVIVAYGPQENEEVEERKDFFIKLSIEIEKTIHAGEGVIVIGDMNAKLDCDPEKNQINGVSGNGVILAELVKSYHLQVMNFSNLCKGQWTWSKEINGVMNKSRLDYLIVSENISKVIRNMEIDENKNLCPFHRVKVKGGNYKVVYSDHNPLITELELIPSKTKEPREPRWVMSSSGLKKFEELTETFDEVGHHGDVYTKFETSLTNTMQKCFPRVWRKKTVEESCCTNQQKELLKFLCQYRKKGKHQRLAADKYIKKVHLCIAERIAMFKRRKVENTVQKLTFKGDFSPNEFWKLKKVLCPQSKMEKTSVILDNGDEVFGDEAVKEAYKIEFENRLEHITMQHEYRGFEEITNALCELYVSAAKTVGTPDFTTEEVSKVIATLKDKKAAEIPNEIYKHAGTGLITEITRVLNWIKNNVNTPKQWNKVLIATLFKNKGSKKNLVNFRGVFLTASLSKLFEKLVKLRHDTTFESVRSNQNGATSGKSPADNVFLVNACIDHAKYINKPLYLCFYDFQQCFDKLWLEDCLVSLWKIGVRDQMLSLILSLNEESEIVVKTPCGKTEAFLVKNIVKQGTVIGPQLCKVSTAEYGSNTPGFQLGLANIKPPIFVDDILTITCNTADCYDSHEQAIFFQYRKRSKYGKTKCVMIIMNAKKADLPPVLEIEDHVMAQVNKTKYVGDIFNKQGTNSDLVEDRVREGTGKMISILALCEESGLGRYTLLIMFLLYKTMFIPMLIFNCQAWSHLSQDNLDTLQTLQLKFLKLILWLPMSTSNAFIFLEFGILPLTHEIQKRRLLFLHHIVTLSECDPVSLAYQQGLRFTHERNWANDIQKLKITYGIQASDTEVSQMSLLKWREVVTRKVELAAFNELCKARLESSKIRDIDYESFKCQTYLSKLDTVSARRIARIRSRMLVCKGNHKKSHVKNMSCRAGCNEDETQDHLLNCTKIHGEVVPLSSSFANNIEEEEENWFVLREAMRRIDNIEKFVNGH